MTPQMLRRLSCLTQAQVAHRLGWTLRTIKRAEGTPIEAWSVGELIRYAAVCGSTTRIVVTDSYCVEMELT